MTEPSLNMKNALAEKYPKKLLNSSEIFVYGPKKDVKLPENVEGFTCEQIGFSFTDRNCNGHLSALDHVNEIGTLIGVSVFKKNLDNKRVVLGYFFDENLSEDEVNANTENISNNFTVFLSVLFTVHKTY
jgi:hypothetical protein